MEDFQHTLKQFGLDVKDWWTMVDYGGLWWTGMNSDSSFFEHPIKLDNKPVRHCAPFDGERDNQWGHAASIDFTHFQRPYAPIVSHFWLVNHPNYVPIGLADLYRLFLDAQMLFAFSGHFIVF